MTLYNLYVERNKSTGGNQRFKKLFRVCHLVLLLLSTLLMLCDSFGRFYITTS
jgi:hypothetical protein